MNYTLYLLFKNIFICSQKFNGTMKYTIRQKKKILHWRNRLNANNFSNHAYKFSKSSIFFFFNNITYNFIDIEQISLLLIKTRNNKM